MMWECEKVKNFWSEVCNILSKIIDYPIPVNPSISLPSQQKTVWLACLTSVKKLLAQHWLPPHSLDMYKCLIQLQDIIMLELYTARVNLAQVSTLMIWNIAAEKTSKCFAQNNDQDMNV